jgi:hypothetical protein
LITKNEMQFIGQEDGDAEENLQHNQATRIFGTHRPFAGSVSGQSADV